MIKLYYDSRTRIITSGSDEPVSFSVAQDLLAANKVDDYNLAFQRLINCDFDADKVDAEYRAMEGDA